MDGKQTVRPFPAMLFDDYSTSSNSHRWRYETKPEERNIYVHYSDNRAQALLRLFGLSLRWHPAVGKAAFSM